MNADGMTGIPTKVHAYYTNGKYFNLAIFKTFIKPTKVNVQYFHSAIHAISMVTTITIVT